MPVYVASRWHCGIENLVLFALVFRKIKTSPFREGPALRPFSKRIMVWCFFE